MTTNRMPKMPSIKNSAQSAAQPAIKAKAKDVEKRPENGKGRVKSFEQLKDLVGA